MTVIGDIARLVRSKNAGPFCLTFDVMFDSPESYRRVLASRVLTKDVFAQLYGVDVQDVQFFECTDALAIKISIPRPYPQGSREDGDSYGGQQHAPLVEIELPD